MKELTAQEARGLVSRIGPSLGYDFTYDPVFPEDRKDVCAVRHMAENGSTYGIAAFILFEQIDTDRVSEHGEGWLGDQFRYSLWVMKADEEPRQIYEDHAYIRPRSKSGLTGTRGRDCSLKGLKLEGGTIRVLHPEGDRVEEQKWRELTFSL